MMKSFLLILSALISTTFSAQSFAQSDQPLTVNVHGARYFTPTDLTTLSAATALIEKVMNSEEFKQAVLNFSYAGVPGFVQNNGLDNQQLYDLLMSGAEALPTQTAADHVMDFDLEMYTGRASVLGYTNPGTLTVWINSNFYDYATVNEIAMNLTHEWCHKMGFDHDYYNTARRPYSVPYGIGYLVRDLGAKMQAQQMALAKQP